MAGDWIKMKVDLASHPKVIAIGAATSLDEDTVVGKLHRLWSWADQHTADGNAPGVTKKWVNAHVRVEGFAEALEKVDWLKATKRGISLPRFEEHNGKTGKQRALTAKRVAKNRNDASVTGALAREDKREDTTSTSARRDFKDAEAVRLKANEFTRILHPKSSKDCSLLLKVAVLALRGDLPESTLDGALAVAGRADTENPFGRFHESLKATRNFNGLLKETIIPQELVDEHGC